MIVERAVAGIIEGFSIAVRSLSVAVAVLLVGRSLLEKAIPGLSGTPFRRFIRLTDIIVVPVKRMLPSTVANRRTDYSPLVSALILLFTGLGISVFLDMVSSGIPG